VAKANARNLEDIFIDLSPLALAPSGPVDTSAHRGRSIQLADPPGERLRAHLSNEEEGGRERTAIGARVVEARSALSLPIRARVGVVGLVQLIALRLTAEDGERLQAFADDVGDAYDRFLATGRAREAARRRFRLLLGVGSTVVGLLLLFGAAWALEARALPLSHFPTRPGVWSGASFTVAGLLLAGTRRRRSGTSSLT